MASYTTWNCFSNILYKYVKQHCSTYINTKCSNLSYNTFYKGTSCLLQGCCGMLCRIICVYAHVTRGVEAMVCAILTEGKRFRPERAGARRAHTCTYSHTHIRTHASRPAASEAETKQRAQMSVSRPHRVPQRRTPWSTPRAAFSSHLISLYLIIGVDWLGKINPTMFHIFNIIYKLR
jgi:hypothetical protein